MKLINKMAVVIQVIMAMIGGGFAPSITKKIDDANRFKLATAGVGVLVTSAVVSALYAYGFTTFSTTDLTFQQLFIGFFIIVLLVDQAIMSGGESSLLKTFRWAWIITLGLVCGFFWVAIWFTPTANQIMMENTMAEIDTIGMKYDTLITPYRLENQTINASIAVNQQSMSEKFDKVVIEVDKGGFGRPDGYGKVAGQLDDLYKRDSIDRTQRIATLIEQRNRTDSLITSINDRRKVEIEAYKLQSKEKGLLKVVSAIDSYIFSSQSPFSDKLFYCSIHLMAFLIECLIFAMQHSFKSSIDVYWSIVREDEEQQEQLRKLQSNKQFQKMMAELSIEALKEENEAERVQTNMEIEKLKEIGPKFRETLQSINSSVEQMKNDFEEDHEIIDEYYTLRAKNRLNGIFSNLFNT